MDACSTIVSGVLSDEMTAQAQQSSKSGPKDASSSSLLSSKGMLLPVELSL